MTAWFTIILCLSISNALSRRDIFENHYEYEQYDLYIDNIDLNEITDNEWFDNALWSEVDVLATYDKKTIIKKCIEQSCLCKYPHSQKKYVCYTISKEASQDFAAKNDIDNYYELEIMTPYNLKIREPPDQQRQQAYNVMTGYTKDYDSKLTTAGGGSVETALHHIIPWGILAKFWNAVLLDGKIKLLCPVLKMVQSHMSTKYNAIGSGSENDANPLSPVSEIASTIAGICDRTGIEAITHSDATGIGSPPGGTYLGPMWYWMPGNLFIGPKIRSDDPTQETGEINIRPEFEKNCRPIIGWKHFRTEEKAFDELSKYIKNHGDWNDVQRSAQIRKCLPLLMEIAKIKKPFPLKAAQWVLSDGKYHIKQI